jgi:hypothetical protein
MSKVVADYPGKVHYVEIDIEEDPDIGQSAGVQGTPTVQVCSCEVLLSGGSCVCWCVSPVLGAEVL